MTASSTDSSAAADRQLNDAAAANQNLYLDEITFEPLPPASTLSASVPPQDMISYALRTVTNSDSGLSECNEYVTMETIEDRLNVVHLPNIDTTQLNETFKYIPVSLNDRNNNGTEMEEDASYNGILNPPSLESFPLPSNEDLFTRNKKILEVPPDASWQQEQALDLRPEIQTEASWHLSTSPGELPENNEIASLQAKGYQGSDSRRSSKSDTKEDPIPVSDEVLLSLSVRDLNKQLHGLPRDQVAKVKQKRRTLKNRGYAQNCRSKRMVQRQDLEVTNTSLCKEMQALVNELDEVKRERDLLKQRLDALAQ